MTTGPDAEYIAMRRRMSRLRVNCGKKSSLEGKISPECQTVCIQMRRRITRRLIWIQTVCNNYHKCALIVQRVKLVLNTITEDVPSGGDDPGFKDLIKYWKRHGIPVPKDLMSDMSDEKVQQTVAKGKGRRRSRELEDLHFCASTGKFNLEKLSIPEADEKGHTPSKRPAAVASRPKGGSLKTKTPSRSNILTNSNPHKKITRTQSNYK